MISDEILNGDLPIEFLSNEEAIKAIEQIIEPTGLKRNFVVLEDSRVGNASALIYNGQRYVLYNKSFMEMVKNVTNTDWAAISIMAHEIGHHLQGHTSLSGGSRPDIELEADEFSGWIMYLVGASLQDAQIAMGEFASENDSQTHPGKFKRLEAIQKGWSNAARRFPRQKKDDDKSPKNEPTYSSKFLHTASKLTDREKERNSGNTHQIRLYIYTSSPQELNEIESVTYNLHETFVDPRITITDPSNGFELIITVWGQFEAQAIIRYKNGSELRKNRYLGF